MDTRTMRIRTAAALCCTSVFAMVPAARALFDKEPDAPAMATFSKTDTSGATVTFCQEDFTSRLAGDDELEGVVINTLPPAEAGVLKVSGRALQCGEGITADGLDTLSFEPAGTQDTHASFSFIPVFDEYGAGDQSVTVSINLANTPNGAPLAEALQFETYVDLACNGQLKATDPEGDPCTYSIVEQPKKGTVEITGDTFCYVPQEGKAYSETFSYCAVDQYGNASNPATVKMTVKKQKSKETIRYADLENDPSHYAAIKLAEAGVFTGEEIGGTYFLSPNETVSRAQFISMVMAGADAPVPTAAIPSGLADDAATPKWAKAASAAALHAGIVTGSPNGSGSRELRAEDPITRAEAAAILDRAAQLPADQLTEEVFADGGEIPQWAAQAVINATNAGILDTQNGQVRPNDTLTRAEAVQMVYRAFPQEEESGGILDFLK